LDRVGLIGKIQVGVTTIYQGRQWPDTEGLEGEGRISYKRGLALAVEAFKETQERAAVDLDLLIVAEYTFLGQELEFCASTDTNAITSLTKSIQEFDEAFCALDLLQNTETYKCLGKAFSHRPEFRYRKMPKDAFHVACAGHMVRIRNILKSPGINLGSNTE
jgi:hypothetical protein